MDSTRDDSNVPTFWAMMRHGLWQMPFRIGWKSTSKFLGFVDFIHEAIASAIERHEGLKHGFWSLHAAAVDPGVQGRGIGAAAMRHFLDRADLDGRPTLLVTQETRAVRLYERLGFKVLDQQPVVVDGVDLGFENWVMSRWPPSSTDG
ncbi:unnamed protein product [Choristocarpus tenellus]